MWGLRVAWRAVWTAAFAEFAMARSHRSSTRSTRGCPPSASPHAGTLVGLPKQRVTSRVGPLVGDRFGYPATAAMPPDHLEAESPGIPAGLAEVLRMRMRSKDYPRSLGFADSAWQST